MNYITQSDDESGKQSKIRGFVALPVMITVATSMLFGGALMSKNSAVEASESVQVEEKTITAKEKEELLWLARVLYSETKRYDEQELVAWVVRNRVEAGYWGDTYKEVVLAKGQFSGLHPTDANYAINIQKGDHSNDVAWKNAVAIAEKVYYADSSERPFSPTVRHFYSPISVTNHPSWAANTKPVLEIDSEVGVRFAFYSGIQ